MLRRTLVGATLVVMEMGREPAEGMEMGPPERVAPRLLEEAEAEEASGGEGVA